VVRTGWGVENGFGVKSGKRVGWGLAKWLEVKFDEKVGVLRKGIGNKSSVHFGLT